MIKFIEKEPYYDDSPFTGGHYMYPTYMIKDGKEYFMFNRREPQPSYKDKKDEAFKNFLISTDGRYFKFNGYLDDPLEMLKIIAERKHHFTNPENTYYSNIEENGFLDFHGNIKEVSAAFFYRIYDVNLAEIIRKIVEMLNMEEWEKVIWEVKKESEK